MVAIAGEGEGVSVVEVVEELGVGEVEPTQHFSQSTQLAPMLTGPEEASMRAKGWIMLPSPIVIGAVLNVGVVSDEGGVQEEAGRIRTALSDMCAVWWICGCGWDVKVGWNAATEEGVALGWGGGCDCAVSVASRDMFSVPSMFSPCQIGYPINLFRRPGILSSRTSSREVVVECFAFAFSDS